MMENKIKLLDIVKADGAVPRMIITTGALDRDKEILEPDGMVSDAFLNNPVLLWMHDMWNLPIGKVESLTRTAQGWEAALSFVPGDIYPLAATIEAMFKAGFVNASSIRFRPIEWVTGNIEQDGFYTKYTKWELLEVSLVTIPANPEALIAGKAQPVREWIKSIEKALGPDPALANKQTQPHAEDGPAGHSQAPAGSTLTTETDAGAISSSDANSGSKTITIHAGDGHQFFNMEELRKSGAGFSKKNRLRLRKVKQALRECHDDMEDLMSGWPDDEPDEDEGKTIQGDAPAKDTPAHDAGESRKTGTADGDSSDALRLAQAIREAQGARS